MAQTTIKARQLDVNTSTGPIFYLASGFSDLTEDLASMYTLSSVKDNTGPWTGSSGAVVTSSEYKHLIFATGPGVPFTQTITKGTFKFYVTLKQTAGTRTVVGRVKLYKQDEAGTQTLLVTSSSTPNLTSSYVTYELTVNGGPFTLNQTDRLVAKIYYQGSASGTDANVTIQYANTDGERIELPPIQTYNNAVIRTGWQRVYETWTRTGNYTFTVSGDYTAVYRKGTKVRYKDGSTYEYGVVGSSSYSAPNTTVTLITNSDYAMAATTITDRYVSYVETPDGFPQWFNWTTTASRSGTNYTNLPTINYAKWMCVGAQVFITLRATMNATPGGTGYQIYTLPINPANSALAVGMNASDIYAVSAILDAGTGQLRGWKYDGTAEAVASKIYSYSGSYNI